MRSRKWLSAKKQVLKGKVVGYVDDDDGVKLTIKWNKDGATTSHGLDMDGLESLEIVEVPALVDCTIIDEEWKIFRDLAARATGTDSLPFFVTLKRKKDLILQALMRNPETSKCPAVMQIFQIESTSPLAAIEVERVFSAHNLIKTPLRTGLTIESSAAQARLLMMKNRLDFGSERFEQDILKIVKSLVETKRFPRFEYDMKPTLKRAREDKEMIADAKRAMRTELAEELKPMISNVVRAEFVAQYSVRAAEVARVVIGQHLQGAIREIEMSVRKIE